MIGLLSIYLFVPSPLVSCLCVFSLRLILYVTDQDFHRNTLPTTSDIFWLFLILFLILFTFFASLNTSYMFIPTLSFFFLLFYSTQHSDSFVTVFHLYSFPVSSSTSISHSSPSLLSEVTLLFTSFTCSSFISP